MATRTQDHDDRPSSSAAAAAAAESLPGSPQSERPRGGAEGEGPPLADAPPSNLPSDPPEQQPPSPAAVAGEEEEEEDFLADVPPDTTALDLNHERIRDVASLRLERFSKLQTLCLRQNLLTTLEGVEWSALPDLRDLDVYDNRIATIGPGTLAPLHALTSLDVSFNNLTTLPATVLAGQGQLRKLYAAVNQLASLDAELGQSCPALEILEVGGNRLRRLPESLDLPCLQELWLGKNKLKRIQGLASLANLRILSIQSNRLSVMEGLAGCAGLEELYLSHNAITRIQGLEGCRRLRVLDVSNNAITELEGLEPCPLLEELWANDNGIHSYAQIEAQLASKPKLHTLYLERNPVSGPEQPMYRPKLKTMLPHLVQIDATLCRVTTTTPLCVQKTPTATPPGHSTMSRHSKNNAARSFFTAAEKAKLTNVYGTITQRLGGDSMRAFDACYLCLHPARAPVVCGQGHLACRECALTHLLAQKQAIAVQERKREALLAEREGAEERRRELLKRKEVEEFERTEAKIARREGELRAAVASGAGARGASGSAGSASRALVAGSAGRAADATATATGEEEEDTVDARNKRAFGRSSFWIPCQAPESKEAILPPPGREVYCTASATPHVVTFKKLVPVHFTRDPGAGASSGTEKGPDKQDGQGPIICPACSKALHNGTRITVLRPCGHAYCTPCATQFVQTACTVCETPCKSAKGGWIPLHSEGTGFSGSGGLLLTKRETFAFQ